MNVGEIEQALTRKYGPLPGYAWAGAGALLLVLILRRGGGSSSSSSPAFLTTPPQAAVSGADSLGAGGGGGGSDGSSVDPAISYGLPSVDPVAIDNGPASSTAPTDAPGYDNSLQLTGAAPADAIAAGYTAADYYAANPLPQGTSTADALTALSEFPATSYPFVYSGPVMDPQYVTPANQPPAITTAPSPATTITSPTSSPSLIELHYLHGRDPEA